MQGNSSQRTRIADAAHPLPDLRVSASPAQDPYNNVVRTTIEALASVLGGTQSLHTNSLDEAIALPTDFSARIARNTQLYLQDETGLCRVVDPLGGSLPYRGSHIGWPGRAGADRRGGGAGRHGQGHRIGGLPKLRIEESAARRQARSRPRRGLRGGVNRYRPAEETEAILLEVDNAAGARGRSAT